MNTDNQTNQNRLAQTRAAGILFGAYALLRHGVFVPRRLRVSTAARTS